MASCSDLQREWHHAAGTLYEPRNAVLVFKVSSPDSELPSYYRRCCYHVVHPFSPLNSQKGYNLSMSATTLFRIICFELMWDNMFCSERVNKIGTPLPVAFDYPPPPPPRNKNPHHQNRWTSNLCRSAVVVCRKVYLDFFCCI